PGLACVIAAGGRSMPRRDLNSGIIFGGLMSGELSPEVAAALLREQIDGRVTTFPLGCWIPCVTPGTKTRPSSTRQAKIIRQFEAEGERAAALAKLEAAPGRFALVHHCVLTAGTLEDTDPIGLASLEAGIRLAEWCANEADRVYRMLGESAAEKKLRGLVELVVRLAARNGGRVTVKILQKANSRKYRTRDAAGADLGRLAEVGLGRWEDGPEPECGGKRQRFFVPTVATADEDANPDPDPDPTSDECDH